MDGMRDQSTTTETLRVYAVQPDVAWHDPATNRDRVRRMVETANVEPGSLIALPETFASGFTNDVDAATDSPANETALFLEELAADTQSYVIGGLVSSDPLTGLGLNQAVCCSPTAGEVLRYAKVNRFPMSGEPDHFAAGEAVDVFDVEGVGGASVCPLICYDLRFPETFRLGAGSDVFVLIANWPATRMHHWHALLRARAIENQAFVVGVNRTGSDPAVQYSGGTVIYDYDGHCVTELDERPGIASALLDLSALRQFRRQLPFLPPTKTRRTLATA